jgi:hypothetical protein
LARHGVADDAAALDHAIRIVRELAAAAEKVGASIAWRELSLFAVTHIASDGNVIAKETEHFPSSVRPSRIGIGSGGTATRPSVASSMDAPLL